MQDLAAATPDLTTLVQGRQRPARTRSPTTRRARRSEGYLFWLSWLNHLGTTVFATQDAHGPIRHGVIVLSCSTAQLLESTAAASPNLGVLVALLNAPTAAQICPKSGQASP